ncbi:MAG: hypothetical protein KKD05_03370 [Candidatus Omnitrophica bacterium]|nr:hypothetical protein [Candidatus Omnitrophota bacterium]
MNGTQIYNSILGNDSHCLRGEIREVNYEKLSKKAIANVEDAMLKYVN